MKPNARPSRLAPMLSMLLLLLSACAGDSPLLQPIPAVAIPLIPPLPPAARQPPTPPECSPSCSAGLTRLRESLLGSLTSAGSPAAPASGPIPN